MNLPPWVLWLIIPAGLALVWLLELWRQADARRELSYRRKDRR